MPTMEENVKFVDKQINSVNERIEKFKKLPRSGVRLKYLKALQKEKTSWVNYAISLKKEQDGIKRLKGEHV